MHYICKLLIYFAQVKQRSMFSECTGTEFFAKENEKFEFYFMVNLPSFFFRLQIEVYAIFVKNLMSNIILFLQKCIC